MMTDLSLNPLQTLTPAVPEVPPPPPPADAAPAPAAPGATDASDPDAASRMGLDQVMTRCHEHLVECRAEDTEVRHASTLVSHTYRWPCSP
jgi:hypothetical protein